MTEIFKTYFGDLLSSNDDNEGSQFSLPTSVDTIRQVERILGLSLPQDYVDFLLITNGYHGAIGQSHCRFFPIEQVVKYTKDYGGEYFPWIVVIGTDGGNEMYVIDKRKKPTFGILPYIGDESDFIVLGDTFEEFIRHLYHNDFWKDLNGR